jgi:membrane-associated protease RseP (regulator of RpoE activity)
MKTMLKRIGVSVLAAVLFLSAAAAHAGKLGATLRDTRDGVAVVKVVPHGAAAEAGLQPGDLITELDGEEVTTAQEVRDSIDQSGEDTVEITLVRVSATGHEEELTKKVNIGGLTEADFKPGTDGKKHGARGEHRGSKVKGKKRGGRGDYGPARKNRKKGRGPARPPRNLLDR